MKLKLTENNIYFLLLLMFKYWIWSSIMSHKLSPIWSVRFWNCLVEESNFFKFSFLRWIFHDQSCYYKIFVEDRTFKINFEAKGPLTSKVLWLRLPFKTYKWFSWRWLFITRVLRHIIHDRNSKLALLCHRRWGGLFTTRVTLIKHA